MLQAEKEKTECRIKAWNDQITLKQKELDHLTGNKHLISFALVKLKYVHLPITTILFLCAQVLQLVLFVLRIYQTGIFQ